MPALIELAHQLIDQPEHQVRVVEVGILQERLIRVDMDRGEARREVVFQAEQLGGLAAAAVAGERRQCIPPVIGALLLDVLSEQLRSRVCCSADKST